VTVLKIQEDETHDDPGVQRPPQNKSKTANR
jgi:hypothetical protein